MKCGVCGNEEFEQEGLAKIKERVYLMKESPKSVVLVVGFDMQDVTEEDIEHYNEFRCIKCDTRYVIVNDRGVERVV